MKHVERIENLVTVTVTHEEAIIQVGGKRGVYIQPNNLGSTLGCLSCVEALALRDWGRDVSIWPAIALACLRMRLRLRSYNYREPEDWSPPAEPLLHLAGSADDVRQRPS